MAHISVKYFFLTTISTFLIMNILKNIVEKFEYDKISVPEDYMDMDMDRGGIKYRLSIIHTNDLHSHISGCCGPVAVPSKQKGNYAKIASFISAKRRELEEQGNAVLVLDAGDWYSGSIFDRIGIAEEHTAVPELEYFHHVQYDAITFGNHEFDRGIHALSTMISKSHDQDLDVTIVASNLVKESCNASGIDRFFDNNNGDSTTKTKIVDELVKEIPARDFGSNSSSSSSVSSSIKVGVLALLGPDAGMCR